MLPEFAILETEERMLTDGNSGAGTHKFVDSDGARKPRSVQNQFKKLGHLHKRTVKKCHMTRTTIVNHWEEMVP